MTEKQRRDNIIKCRVNDEEMDKIAHKFNDSGYFKLSDYIRNMCVNGVILTMRNDDMRFITRQLAGASTNINQIAYKCNQFGNLPEEQYYELLENARIIKEIMMNLHTKVAVVNGSSEHTPDTQNC